MINFYEFKQKLEEGFESRSNFADYGLLRDPKLQNIDNLELLLHSKIEQLEKDGDIKNLQKMQGVLQKVEIALEKATSDFRTKGHGGYAGG